MDGFEWRLGLSGKIGKLGYKEMIQDASQRRRKEG